MPTPPPADTFLYRRRVITEPDGFGDAVSGIQLTVDFQHRQSQSSRVEQFQSPDWAFDFGEVHAKTQVQGVLLGGWASLCLVRGPNPATWNGLPAQTGTITCLPPQAELDGATASGFSWTTIAVPPQVWARCQRLAGVEEGRQSHFMVQHLSPEILTLLGSRIDGVRNLLHSPPPLPEICSREAADLAEHCFTLICELSSGPQRLRDSLRNRARLARRASHWMRDHLPEKVQVPDVCLAFGVSRRELEYAFRSIFDQSPRDYLETLRLNAVRRTLLTTDLPIIHAAMDCGITHLGRFAAQYRKLFGERPVDTQRAAPFA